MANDMNGFSWLNQPIHKSIFKGLKYNWQDHPEVIETVKVSFEGSIMAVMTSKVQKYLDMPEVEKVRMKLAPPPKRHKVDNEDEFYHLLAYCVEIAEE